ncbi:hypothetical protein AB0O07_04245 [Streptomyces sp. NPDC093085]|uniref:hypothetical protein n=1 Tax=Streptomyces sp. NPDC093085 TaxID=3155068 RepID=UPI00341704E9
MTVAPYTPARGLAARWVARAPAGVRPYLEVLRLDRPVGAWLLVVPGWIALAAIAGPLLGWFGALTGLGPLYWPGLAVVAGQLGWQVWRADPADAGACGRAFATNPLCGVLMVLAVLAGRIGTLG